MQLCLAQNVLKFFPGYLAPPFALLFQSLFKIHPVVAFNTNSKLFRCYEFLLVTSEWSSSSSSNLWQNCERALLCQGSGHTPQDNHKDLTRNRKLFLNETSTEAVGTSTFGYSSDTKDFRTTYKYILQDFEYVAFWPFHGMLQGLTCYVDTVTALGGWNDVGSG